MLAAIATCGENGANIGAIADGLVMDRTTLSRNLAPLEKANMVRVARDPNDARVRLVFLTRQGRARHRDSLPALGADPKHVRESSAAPRSTRSARSSAGSSPWRRSPRAPSPARSSKRRAK